MIIIHIIMIIIMNFQVFTLSLESFISSFSLFQFHSLSFVVYM